MPCADAALFPFWQQLTQPQKDRLFQEVREVHYARHAPVRAAGDSCLGILYVKTGGLRLSLLSEEGREASIARLGAGQVCVLSASCVLSAVTFDVEITAEEESDILVLPSHVFGPLMAENIYVECFVYRTATELFSDVIGAVERLLFMTLEQRVASFLLDEAARRGTDTLAITQEAIALGIASAREAVTRALRQLAARGLVEVFRGGVKLLDRKALNALC